MSTGYACPVCDVLHTEVGQLADHLAVMGALDRPAHLEWLESHAPDWSRGGVEDLAPIVAEHAREVDVVIPDDGPSSQERSSPAIDVDKPSFVGGYDSRERDRQRFESDQPALEADPTIQGVLEEARELTRQRRGERDTVEADPTDDADSRDDNVEASDDADSGADTNSSNDPDSSDEHRSETQ